MSIHSDFQIFCLRCKSYPPRIVMVYAGYILSLLALFAKFYVDSYTKKPKKVASNGTAVKHKKTA